MIESPKSTLTLNWLKTKLINGENGIIFDDDSSNFDLIQNFIESADHNLKTPVVYYQAFPEESATQFLDTLSKELVSKLGIPELNSSQSLFKIIEVAALKMVIIDKSQLHPIDTLQNLLDFFACCDVALILVGSRSKMETSQILSHPAVAHWDQFLAYGEYETSSRLC